MKPDTLFSLRICLLKTWSGRFCARISCCDELRISRRFLSFVARPDDHRALSAPGPATGGGGFFGLFLAADFGSPAESAISRPPPPASFTFAPTADLRPAAFCSGEAG